MTHRTGCKWMGRRAAAVAAAVVLLAGGVIGMGIAVADEAKAIRIPGRQAYRAALAEAEANYVKQVTAARQQQIEAIRDLMMRARMTPAAYKALTDELKRLESLGKPRVDPEPAAGGNVTTVRIAMDTPSPLWSLAFVQARRIDNELWVLWKLSQKDGMGAMVITKRSASATLAVGDLPADAPVRHFVIGKTFNWSDPNVEAKYIDAETDLGDKWPDAPTLKPADG